jgi:hypothetical protein
MVMYALDDMGIPHPRFENAWYRQSALVHARAIKKWGDRIASPSYDGDVIWLRALTATPLRKAADPSAWL